MLAGLPEAERDRLEDILQHLAAHLRARAQPLMVDLDDDDPGELASRWFEAHRPTLEAASDFARGCWSTSDGTVAVAVVTRCPPARDAIRCVPLRGGGAMADFLAWPLTHAIELRAATPDNALAARRALRALTATQGSDAALVVPETPGEWEARPALVTAAGTVLRFIPPELALQRVALEPFAAPPTTRALPWWEADPLRVLVVPRLSAFGAPRRVEAEVWASLRRAGLASRVVVRNGADASGDGPRRSGEAP